MRSVKIERAQRANPRAQAARKPARTSRKVAAKPAAHHASDGYTYGSWERVQALLTRPMLALTGGLTVFALFAALLVGGYAGRGLHAVHNGIAALVADAGFGISDIHISGYRRTPYQSVIAALSMQPGQSIFAADLGEAYQRLSRLPWVASVDVMRRYPDSIFVAVVEKRPFALWQSPDGIVVVERNGHVITGEDIEKFARLPKLVGAGAPAAAAELIDAVATHRAVAARVAAYQRQSRRRWNLILDDGVVVKLPEAGWRKQLGALEHLIIDAGILERDVTEIDLRSPPHYFFMLKTGEKKDMPREKET
ncbi:MAG TPA: FtsQ-type POTRA domain-containing protein [Rhizomicrobium sp.]|jgi:cell division protein FtsQ|nr:FtsQ-type POTRA domain-containing protein [Rhizomicrobium sp.]